MLGGEKYEILHLIVKGCIEGRRSAWAEKKCRGCDRPENNW